MGGERFPSQKGLTREGGDTLTRDTDVDPSAEPTSPMPDPSLAPSGEGDSQTSLGEGRTATDPNHPVVQVAPTAQLPRGTVIDRYTILKRLGAGGMGVVYEAHDPELDRLVAIKILRSDVFGAKDNTQGRARMLREAQAMARLSHPNVITVFDIGTFGSEMFVAMEYVSGGTLREWLNKERRPWRQILDHFSLSGQGLAAAHDAGLIHRDFKPDNVLVGNDGRVRVTDFGLARSVMYVEEPRDHTAATLPADVDELAMSRPLGTPLTAAGKLLGTPRFISPEQLETGQTDPRSDQFSFCVSVYEALYGVNPFVGKTIDQRIINMRLGELQPPRADYDRGAPPWVHAVLARGLLADPEQRFPSMHALLDALSWRARKRRRIFMATVLGTAGLMALGFTGLMLRPYYACRGVESRLSSVWNPGRKHLLPATLVGAIDRYLGDFTPAYHRACLNSYRDPRWNTALSCLERRKDEMSALIDIAAQEGGRLDALALRRAAEVPYRLPWIAACASAVNVAPPTAPPSDPAARAAIAAVKKELARVRVHSALEQCDAASAEARSALVKATKLGYKPLEAETLYLGAFCESQRRDPEQAHEMLTAATHAAKEGHDQLLLSEVLTWRVIHTAWQVRTDEEAAYLQKRASSAQLVQNAIADVAAPAPEWLKQQCVIDVALQLPRAGEKCQKVLELYRGRLGPDHVETALVEAQVAMALRQQGQFAPALAGYARALETLNKYLDPHNPLLIQTMIESGEALCMADRCAEARALFTQVVARRREQNRSASEIGMLLDKLRRPLADGGQYEKAAEYLSEAVNLLLTQPKQKELVLGDLLPPLIRYYELLGEFDKAQREAERLLELTNAGFGAGGWQAGDARYFVGEVLSARGQPGAARAQFEQAAKLLNLQGKEPLRKRALTAFAVTLLELGDNEAALTQLDEAAKLPNSLPALKIFPNPSEAAADHDFWLARALYENKRSDRRSEYQTLLERARHGYVASGRISQRRLEALDKWVAQHGPSL